MVSVPDLDINQNLVMVKLSIFNESHNIGNIIFNVKIWEMYMAVGIGEINS